MELKLINCSACGGTGEYTYFANERTEVAKICEYCGGSGSLLLVTDDGNAVGKIKIVK